MRRKGELSKSSIDAGWPYQVGIPNKEVGSRYPAIKAFCEGLSLCQGKHTFVRDHQYIDVLLLRPRARPALCVRVRWAR